MGGQPRSCSVLLAFALLRFQQRKPKKQLALPTQTQLCNQAIAVLKSFMEKLEQLSCLAVCKPAYQFDWKGPQCLRLITKLKEHATTCLTQT